MRVNLHKFRDFSILIMTFVLILTAFALAGCGKSGGKAFKSASILPGEGMDIFENGLPDAESLGFAIEELKDANPDPSQAGDLLLRVIGRDEKGRVQVAIDAANAIGFKSALLNLHFDNSRFSPAAVHLGSFLHEAIFLAVTSVSDYVPVAAVLPNPLEREGASGSGRIAVVTFDERPAGMSRRVSSVPLNVENRISSATVIDDPDNGRITITFTETNMGDYNLDTVVAVTDVTPIALNYLEIVGIPDPAVDRIAVIDGDGSGQVGITDITPIALNYLNKVEAYSIRWGYLDEGGGNTVSIGDLPNSDEPGAAYSMGRDYMEDGLRPRYSYTFDYGESAQYSGENGDDLRFWIRPYADGAFGIEGGPFSTGTNPSLDTTPPVWQTGFGIISSEYNTENTEINITFGLAEDADSPPVVYVAYWQLGEELYYPSARESGRLVFLDVSGQTAPPFSAKLTAADGLPMGEVVSVGVHARDSAVPPNETAELSPHPFNPGGLDWIIVQPKGPGDDTPPVWQTTQGISEAKPGNTAVTVGWGLAWHAEGAVTYEVYWLAGDYTGAQAGQTPEQFFSIANHETATGSFQHTISGLTNGEVYSFGVRARSPRGMFDSNTRVLTATPMDSVFPFMVPPDGKHYPSAYSMDSDIALTPIDNAPVVVYTDADPYGLGICYFDGFTWIHEMVAAGAYFDHPSIEIIGDKIYLSAFNRTMQAMELYKGDVNAQNWELTTIDVYSRGTDSIYQVLAANLEYEPDSDTLGIVYNACLDGSRGILKYAFRIGEGDWTIEIIQDTPGVTNTPGACFVFTPDGRPSVAYTYGYFNWNQHQFDTLAHYALRENGEWIVEKIPGDWLATQPIFLTYNTGTDQPFIAIGRDRIVELGGEPVWVLDAVAAWKDEMGEWQSQVVEQGEGFFSLSPPSVYIKFAGADPAMGFNKAGHGFIFCSTIEIEDLDIEPPIYSQITKYTFDGANWSDYERPDSLRQGCSAVNLAIDVTEPRVVYQEIGVVHLIDLEILNNFPPGDLVYWQF